MPGDPTSPQAANAHAIAEQPTATAPSSSDAELATSPHSCATTVAGTGEPKNPSLLDYNQALDSLRTPTGHNPAPPKQPTLTPRPLPSNLRRYCLLVVFCLAQFFDIFSGSAVLIAVPDMSEALGMSPAEGTWLVNAYTLSLSAFMLAAGRVSDMFSAKWTFVIGFAWVGLFSLGIGLAGDKVTVIVLRAFSGIGAAATIPAALNLIAHLFPGEREQALAISMFSGCGAIANVLGLILGGVLLLASYQWIFHLVAICCIPGAIVAALLIPGHADALGNHESDSATETAPDGTTYTIDNTRKPKMDFLGLLLLTAAIVLLIFGVSNGNVEGFDRAQTLAPLILGVLLFPAFFLWERRVSPVDALIDPAMWSVRNFLVIVIIGLVPNLWWFLVQVVFSEVAQREWGMSAIMTAVHFLPLSVAGGTVVMTNGLLPERFRLKWRIVSGGVGAIVGSLLLAFASEERFYWPLVFPGFAVGSGSMALLWVSCYVALMLSVPRRRSGVAGAVFNSSLQLGCSVGLSIATAIQVSYPARGTGGTTGRPITPSWRGYQISLFFVLATVAIIPLLTLVFFRDPTVSEPAADKEVGVREKGTPASA